MASMLGKATYLDEESEELWSSFGKDMKDWLEEMKVIPVEEESLFPSPAELFAQGFKDGKTDKQNWDYIDAIYKDKFKINNISFSLILFAFRWYANSLRSHPNIQRN